jgi:hypothetical protein
VVGLTLALVLAINFIAGITAPDKLAVDAAIAKCQTEGWPAADIHLSGSQISGNGIGKTAVLTLNANDRNRSRTIHVTLRKPINLMRWRVADYREEQRD